MSPSASPQHGRGASWHVLAARAAWLVVVLAFAVGAVGGMHRALRGRPDWSVLQKEVRFVAEHGHTAPDTAMFGYLPTTTFALWPFMVWLPRPAGAALYVLSNLIAGAAAIWLVQRWWLPGAAPWRGFAWPVLLASANFAHAIQANQLTLWTLLLCVAGLALVERRREVGGGLVLGLAALLKTLPGLLAAYLLLRRRWRALAAMGTAAVMFDVLPSLLYFGGTGALTEHRAWLRRTGWHSNYRQIAEPLLRADRLGTNSSYSAVLARWLRAVPAAGQQIVLYGQPPPEIVARTRAALEPDEVLALDPTPPREAVWSQRRVNIAWVPRFHIADLSADAVWRLWAATLAVGLAALAWVTWRSRRPAAADGALDPASHALVDGQPGDATGMPWQPLAAAWLLAMFWPSPLVGHYYLAWAFPAVALVWSGLRRASQVGHGRRTAGTVLAVAALVLWVLGVAALGWKLGRWYGIHLAALAVLLAATLRLCRRADFTPA